jgi:plasmid replication initiation protein
MPREIITKANALINASYRLSLTEMQIVLYGVSLINPISKEVPLEYQIKISDFATLFNRNHGDIYQDIKQAVFNKFWLRDIRYIDEKTAKYIAIRWLTKIEYSDNTGFFSVKFSEEIKPFLRELSTRFTVYYIDQIAKFRSVYSVRFYEYAILEINKMKADTCFFMMSLSDMKDKLELNDRYNKYSNFKARVLQKAQVEINKHSDLTIDFKEIKKGRTVESIKFIIQRKDGAKPAKYVEEKQKELELNTELNTDTSPMSEDEFNNLMRKNSIKTQLFGYRVAEKVTCQLLRDYDFERIERALNYMDKTIKKGKEIKNKPAYLVNAIKEGY